MPRWYAPRSERPAACRSPATNPSHIATHCSAPSPTGATHISGYSSGADCAATLACLRALGVPIQKRGADVEITGRGLHGLTAAAGPVDAANSGTTMRLLSGLAAAHPFRTTIVGDASLTRRPMRRVIAPLTEMGATIHSDDGRPPLTIEGAPLHGITYRPDVPSAQVKSSVLLAGLHASGQTVVVEPAATRDHTERALTAFGVTLDRDGLSVGLPRRSAAAGPRPSRFPGISQGRRSGVPLRPACRAASSTSRAWASTPRGRACSISCGAPGRRST